MKRSVRFTTSCRRVTFTRLRRSRVVICVRQSRASAFPSSVEMELEILASTTSVQFWRDTVAIFTTPRVVV